LPKVHIFVQRLVSGTGRGFGSAPLKKHKRWVPFFKDETDNLMKNRLTLLLTTLMAFGCTVDKKANSNSDTVIESITVDSDLFTDIILTADTLIENGTFNKVQFKSRDKVVFELYDEDAYDTIETKAIEIKNETASRNILLQKVGDKYYVTIFGAEYGCCPRELTIIQADKNGISKIFKDSFEVSKISKTDNDDIKYFGIESFSEPLYPIDSLDILLFTYNPTLVYSLGEGFKFDSLTTKKYNEEHYVFAGFNYKGEIKVAFPKDGQDRKSGTRKPYIFSED
jgi:hypothetical protein